MTSAILLAFDTIMSTGSFFKLLTSFDKDRGEDALGTTSTAITGLSELADISQLTREQLHKAEPRLSTLWMHKDAAIGSGRDMWQLQ